MPEVILKIHVPEIIFRTFILPNDELSISGNLVLEMRCDTEVREAFTFMAVAQGRVAQAKDEFMRQEHNIAPAGERIGTIDGVTREQWLASRGGACDKIIGAQP